MTTLQYKPGIDIEDLHVGECTMRRAAVTAGEGATTYWNLWFCVNRETDGQPDTFGVPVNPNGPFLEHGTGGKTWGLTPVGAGQWQIAPSINVLNTRELHPGEHELPSLWHQTPTIIDVPDSEPWIASPASSSSRS